MCVPPDSHPPIPGVEGASTDTRRPIVEAEDGTRFDAFEAFPSSPSGTAVVVLPDVRGLFPFYEELASRFAEIGHRSIAIDYFGRTAPPVAERPDDFDFMSHVRQMTQQGLTADVAATLAHLDADAPDTSVVTVGFCLGGSNSWYQAANGFGLAGAIGFYGHPARDLPPGLGSVIDRVPLMECPILALMAGEDQSITPDVVESFEDALGEHDVTNEVVVYDGAPHSFFDRRYEEHAGASADAWSRVRAFIDSVG